MIAVSEIVSESMRAWRPPARLHLDEWADEHFYLSPESAAEPGRWRCLPYQRGMMRAITDPRVEQVTVMKSARVGFTKVMNATIGYYMHQDPCAVMVVQPTIEDAQGYSKEEIAPMLRDCPALAEIMPEPSAKDSTQTILHKEFPGGLLSLVGANSARGFRRVSRKVVIFDEVDGYPPSAGTEGDQIKLGIRRTDTFWDRKIIAGSTPLRSGTSRIEEMFESGDQRRFYVPCPHCEHMDFLVFRESFVLDGVQAGHFMQWPEGKPEEAHFVCRECGAAIEHKSKREMIEAGEWRARGEFRRHASFHIWAAYSFSPNTTWAHIAKEFVEANLGGLEQLKTFVNTVLGETWEDRGDAPEWQALYFRRETYPMGTAPAGVKLLTAGVDVQKDRLIFEIVGWGEDKQSWSIEAGVIPGNTAEESAPAWNRLGELLNQRWTGADGAQHSIRMLAVDSGFNTNTVYSWVRRFPMSRVIATKGSSTQTTIIGKPSPVDVTVSGKKISRGCKVWSVGVDTAKAELYGWLRLEIPEAGSPWPIGFCHFPEHDEDYFKQITAEQLVPIQKRTGRTEFEWHVQPGRENHLLDCRIMARAAAALLGLDRMRKSAPTHLSPPTPSLDPRPIVPGPPREPSSAHAAAAEKQTQKPRTSGPSNDWLDGRGNNWLNRKKR